MSSASATIEDDDAVKSITETEHKDCLNSVAINSVDLCQLADKQFVDRIKSGRVQQKMGDDIRSAAVTSTGRLLARSRHAALTLNNDPKISNSTTRNSGTRQTTSTSGHRNRAKTVEFVRLPDTGPVCDPDAAVESTALNGEDSNCRTSSQNQLLNDKTEEAVSGVENGRSVSEEIRSMPSPNSNRPPLSLYNLHVWQQADNKAATPGKPYSTVRINSSSADQRQTGSSGGSQRQGVSQAPPMSSERTRYWTAASQSPRCAIREPIDRIKALRQSYPDDPILRRILGTGLQLNRHPPQRVSRNATFMSGVIHTRLRTGSRQPGTGTLSQSAVCRGEGVKMNGAMLRFVSRTAIGTRSEENRLPTPTEPQTTSISQHVQRPPSVTLMLERSVSKIEPNWKKDASPLMPEITDRRGDIETASRTSAAPVTAADQHTLKSNQQIESDQQRISSSAASLLSVECSVLTPKPPCNSPDCLVDVGDDYFWPANVTRSSESREAASTRRPMMVSIALSHSNTHQTAAERFQHSQMQAASMTLSGKTPAAQQSASRVLDRDVHRRNFRLRIPPSTTLYQATKLVANHDVIANTPSESPSTSVSESDASKQSRLIVYIPH